jgi:hypothetical protein
MPERLLVVSAGDPMWRGGLSGPRSFYIHADRPLITPDVTSPILHELVHAVTSARSAPGGDWIVEGLADYYSLELLVRSKTVSRRRYTRALARLAERGRGVRDLTVEPADGSVTARAVTALHALDGEIRRATGDKASLDDVVAQLAAVPGAVTLERFRSVVTAVAGRDLAAFFAALPGLRPKTPPGPAAPGAQRETPRHPPGRRAGHSAPR